jgi:hypothetical protein
MTLTLPLRIASALVMCGLAASPASLNASENTHSIPALVQQFLSRTDTQVTSYRALRHLEARNKRFKKHGWLNAWTTLDPESGFTFEIVSEGGSSYIREKVLRKALERELEAYSRGETRSAAIGPANYEFLEPVVGHDGLVSVPLKPKRKDPLLLAGALYLTLEAADLVRIEGTLAKNPSFWTRRVHLVRRYARIDNMRVPLAVDSTAQVVMAGESSFSMSYDYATINGRTVGDPQPRQGSDPNAGESRQRD